MAKYSRHNRQLFALAKPPAEAITLGGSVYRLIRVFKHDFFAATCLYESDGSAELPKIVVKFGREQVFCGFPMAWYGRLLRHHEEGIYRALAGVSGVPRWAGTLSPTAYAIEYIDALPLDHIDAPPKGFFDRLRMLFDAIHARGVGYCDANKRSNILVDSAGQPWLIDYQISIRRCDDWPWPLRSLAAAAVRYVQGSDIYHLYKHKRRLAREELTPEEEQLSRRRGLLHTLHRKLTDPWRSFRRWFLGRLHRKGALISTTAALEDHHQPEKATWRKD